MFDSVKELFFPPRCAACGRALPEGEAFLCSRCRWEVPLTRYWEQTDNPLAERLRTHVPIEKAVAFFFFSHEGGFRQLVHNFKYRSQWRAAERAGEWFGAEIAPCFEGVDALIPMPLHVEKRLKRGYNQAEHLARGMSRSMGVPVDTHVAVRHIKTASQARQSGTRRWDNVTGAFAVHNAERLRGKHLLLIDDVLTTGATMLSLAETILRAAPDSRVSVAVLAATRERDHGADSQ